MHAKQSTCCITLRLRGLILQVSSISGSSSDEEEEQSSTQQDGGRVPGSCRSSSSSPQVPHTHTIVKDGHACA